MSSPFTLRRWGSKQWQMYLLLGIAWASFWQIYDAPSPDRIAVSVASLTGSSICLLGLHLRDHDDSNRVEYWAYVMLIWSLSCYLVFALHSEGWWGLVHQPNLGVVLTEAVILACLHRIFWRVTIKPLRRRRVAKQAAILLEESKKDS